MFEKANEPLLETPEFVFRVVRGLIMGLLLVIIALSAGMAGYHFFEKMSWVDAFVNAAMILSGMGPLAPLNTTAGKIFAGVYAIFSGLAFIFIIGIVFMPVIHRFFHKFHLDAEDDTEKNE